METYIRAFALKKLITFFMSKKKIAKIKLFIYYLLCSVHETKYIKKIEMTPVPGMKRIKQIM